MFCYILLLVSMILASESSSCASFSVCLSRFFDAPLASEGNPIQCPVCQLPFPPRTDDAILNAHVNTHFASLPVASAPPEPEAPVILAPEKCCPVCGFHFPGDSDKHAAFEEHVQNHFRDA